MKMHLAAATLVAATLSSYASADYIVGGQLTQNLNSAAFRDPASVDAAYLATFDITVNPSQPLLIFGNHFGPATSATLGVTQFRPLAIDPSLPQITAVPLPRVNYRDDATAIEAAITAFGPTNALPFGVNGFTVTPSGLPGRAEQSSSLIFNPANFLASATGRIGLSGATSFWYANTPVINTGSVWLGYGDLSLSYDATRAINGDSGWYFNNNLLFGNPVYDVQNFVVSDVIPAAPGTPGSLTLSGDLYTAQEFRDGFGIRANLLVGSFTLTATTAIPEPSSLLGAVLAGTGLLARRRRNVLA